MSIELSRSERAAVYAALVPGFRANRKRYSTAYRGGDSPDALAIDLDRGWRDHARGKGGDCIAFVMCARECNFRSACNYITEIIGREVLGHTPVRPIYSQELLAQAERFQIGLYWRIHRVLITAKRELCGPEHEQAARAVRSLTTWLERVRPATALHSPGWSIYDAVRAMGSMDTCLVRDCIHEAEQAYDMFAAVLFAFWSLDSEGLERAA